MITQEEMQSLKKGTVQRYDIVIFWSTDLLFLF